MPKVCDSLGSKEPGLVMRLRDRESARMAGSVDNNSMPGICI